MNGVSVSALNHPNMANPDASVDDLLNDAALLLECVIEQMHAVAADLGEDNDRHNQDRAVNLYGAVYLAQIARKLLCTGHSKALQLTRLGSDAHRELHDASGSTGIFN